MIRRLYSNSEKMQGMIQFLKRNLTYIYNTYEYEIIVYSMPSPNAENGTKKFQNRTNYAILYYRPSHSAVLANLYYKTNRTSARTALGETALGEGLL